MTSEPPKTSAQLWSELRDAHYEIVQLRVAIRALPDHAVILREALSGDGWQRRTALEYLKAFPERIPELLDQLLGLSTSTGSLPAVISVFQIQRWSLDEHLVASSALRLLSAHEGEGDAPLILNLLSASGMWHALETVTKALLQSEDEEAAEAAREYSDDYGWAFPSRRQPAADAGGDEP